MLASWSLVHPGGLALDNSESSQPTKLLMNNSPSKEGVFRSKVLPGLITATVIGAVTSLFPGGWRWIFVKIQTFWIWFTSSVSVPVWVVALLALVALAAITLFGVVIFAARRSSGSTRDIVSDYFEDTFFGMVWRWSYFNHEIVDLSSFCPRCDMQVYPTRGSSSWALDFAEYSCGECGVELHRFEFGKDEVERQVILRIHQKIRRRLREASAPPTAPNT